MHKKVIILFYPLIESGEIFPNIPWAMLYLERMIRHLDIDVILLDERLDKNYANIIKDVESRLLFAGVSVMIGHQISGAVQFSKTYKSITHKPLMWGGWFPTILPEMALNDGYADYICIGQGEVPFKTFTEKMLLGEDISGITGIGLKKDGILIINKNEQFVNSDIFPPVDFDIIDINRLIDIKGKVPTESRSIDYLATSGCIYSCSFCSAVHIFKNRWFSKKTDQIINDINILINKSNISYVAFRDDNFFANKDFVLDFCKKKIDSKLSFTWEANAHIGYFLRHFNNNDIQLIYDSGCRELRFGAESGDSEILELIKKKITVTDSLHIVKLMKKYKIKIRFLTMACFPINPDKDFWKTINLIGKAILINPDIDARIRFFVPVPKTDLYELCVSKGFILPPSTDELMKFFTQWFTYNYQAPWCNKNYQNDWDNYVNFYFKMANPYFYKKVSPRLRPVAFLLTIFIFPLIFVRFKFNFLKFPIEAKLFKKFVRTNSW